MIHVYDFKVGKKVIYRGSRIGTLFPNSSVRLLALADETNEIAVTFTLNNDVSRVYWVSSYDLHEYEDDF